MTLNEYMDNNRSKENEFMVKRVRMNDGFSISIQASEYHYSLPRVNTDAEFYESFELGYPSELDEVIKPFAEDDDTTETVFPYVPRDVVNKLIEKHGGIFGAVER